MFARHFGRPPEKIGPEEIRSFQVYLTTEKKLAPGTIAISNAALRFLYNVTLQRHWVLEECSRCPKYPTRYPYSQP
jgi:integrase/recombinase XerD